MKKTKISVTDAARNFADCVNRTRYQNVSFVLLKNGEPVAELRPTCCGRGTFITRHEMAALAAAAARIILAASATTSTGRLTKVCR